MKKTLHLVWLVSLLVVCGSIHAQGLAEDFENLTLVDADGNALANSWSYGYGLSNGWKIVGGNIYASAGSANYGYVKSTGKGHDGSNGYLEASYSSTNTASVYVPEPMPGDELTFWVRCTSTSSSTKGKVIIYEADADGNVSTTELFSTQIPGGNATNNPWVQQTVTGVSGKYIAINLVRMQFDDFAVSGGSTPVEQKADLNILQSNILTSVTLDETTTTPWIQYENKGVAATNAKATLYVDGVENNSTVIGDIAAGASAYAYISYDKSKLTAGTYPVYIAITADNDDTETASAKASEAVSVTFSEPVVEPAYSVTAAETAIEVEYGATSFDIKATVKNTNDVASENVVVKLLKGITEAATATIATLAANGEQEVTFTVTEIGQPLSQVSYWVRAGSAQSDEIVVSFKEEVIPEVKDLAIVGVDGSIKLGEDANQLRVTVQNNGNVEIADAPVVLKSGDATLGTAVVSATPGNTGYCMVNVDKSGLEAGTISVTATVTVDDDATPADNTMSKEITVEAAPVAPTFSVSAEDVSVPFGAESFDIVATVKNTNDVASENIEVRLLKGITPVETKTIETLAAGGEVQVTFTVWEFGDAGTTATYYVQAANQVQDEVVVSFENEQPEPVADLAIVQVSGSQIDLNAESTEKFVTVSVVNNGTVDIVEAPVIVKATVNGEQKVLGSAAVSAKAGDDFNTGLVSVVLSTEGLTVGELELTVTVEVENDATPADNTMNKTVSVVDTTVTDGIHAVRAHYGDGARVYTVSGQQVSTVGKGLYIVNGKKVIINK